MDVVTHRSFSEDKLHPAASPTAILGVRFHAWLELTIFMVVALMFDHLVLGDQRFTGINPHPYWVIVILLAAQYGLASGVAAALVSTCVYLSGNQALQAEHLFSRASLLLPVLWLVGGVVVGAIRERHLREAVLLKNRLRDAEAREAVTAQAYQEVRGRKQQLEERVAGDMRSALTVYQSAKAMETMSPGQLMRAIETVVRELTGAKIFSLFLLDRHGLVITIASGWTDLQSNLARRFPPSSLLYEMVVGRRELLTIANETHAAALAGEGIMVAPVVARTGEVLGMLKIEMLPFNHLGIQAVETLRSVADWAAQALLNLRQFEQALSDAVIDPRHSLMTRSYFDRHVQYVKSLGQRAKFPVSMLTLTVHTPQDTSEEVHIKLSRAVRDAVRESLRVVDLAFDYQQEGGQYALVLPTTTREGADTVREKVSAALERKLASHGLRFSFTSSVQALAA